MPVVRDSIGKKPREILTDLEKSIGVFSQNVRAKFKREGEW
jgi:hypothetical protein